MPRPPREAPFESNRMKIRRGTLAQTNRVRASDGDSPLEPDEIFDFDPMLDHLGDHGDVHEGVHGAPAETPAWDPTDPSAG